MKDDPNIKIALSKLMAQAINGNPQGGCYRIVGRLEDLKLFFSQPVRADNYQLQYRLVSNF